MKIQNLAVIFIIIILPISMILTSYVQNQVKTLSLQTSYDTKLNNSTYDALKAFQINTINSDTSDLANSKLRDIEASVNSFFTSLATNFNMQGYNQDILKDYVPALVYTMYDGYYIYSPFTNTLDDTNENEVIVNTGTLETQIKSDAEILNASNENATYKEGERISGLKPYVYYSCRYVKRDGSDFVITYSLDNYITIQGIINIEGELTSVFDHGYLLDNIIEEDYNSGKQYGYRNVRFIVRETGSSNYTESLTEFLEDGNEYIYTKINGVKYYYDELRDQWFSILNGEKLYTNEKFKKENTAGLMYYKEAMKFTEKAKDVYNLGDLTVEDIAEENKDAIFGKSTDEIFDFGSYTVPEGSIEDPDSNFNQHRLAVIRYSIEKNLSIAIANYNNYSGVTANFQMPKLKEDEWEKILNNISIISFLQGLNIGGKIYNGYSIITNNKNKEVVDEDSIYMLTTDGQYHKITDTELKGENNVKGILNIDFETKSYVGENGITKYFIPQPYMGCYSSIVTQTSVETSNNIYKFMENNARDYYDISKEYYIALGRERYGMYRTNNNSEEMKAKFLE